MNNISHIIHKSAGILIKNRRILLEKSINKHNYNSPGGKIEQGETKEQTLIRELSEEFNIRVQEENLKYFKSFSKPHDQDPNKTINIDVFFVNQWEGEPSPQTEVEKIIWVDYEQSLSLPIGSVFKEDVIPYLHSNGYID